MKAVLTIAGSDSSGGAGIQADLKTIAAHHLFGESVITALTAQNTLGVTGVLEVDPVFVGTQIDAVFDDIRPDAVKIGMVSSPAIVGAIADGLDRHKAANVVVDPVMMATSGSALIADAAVDALVRQLFPRSTVITPNIPEAEELTGLKITSPEDMITAAKAISEQYDCAVLCKGGHHMNDANDLLYKNGGYKWFNGRRINNPNTHGTGCTLSSAIASNLAKGFDTETAVGRAKEYISGALEAMLDLGKGSGPLCHGFDIKGEYSRENN